MKETIKLFENGEYKTYERDMAKDPLNVEDWMNASAVDIAQHNYAVKSEDGKPMKPKDAEELGKANVKFIVNYFKNQFNLEQAMKGIAPHVLATDFSRWYNQSAGVLDLVKDKDPKKITPEELENGRKKNPSSFKEMQQNLNYTMKDILSMRAPEFETFIDSLGDNKVKQKRTLTTLDQAFPQFFTDPFANRKEKD